MKVSKVVREYIEDTLREQYKKAVKSDPVIQQWEEVKKKKELLEDQLEDEFRERAIKEFGELGFDPKNITVHVSAYWYTGHPLYKQASARQDLYDNQLSKSVNNILLELELGGATKKDLEAMLAKVSFGE